MVLLVVRLVQRSTVQFVVNALFGIGIGWLFVTMSARSGGSADDQALAYFLPGIIYNTGYSVVLAFTCLIGWPLVGFMVGSVTGDPTAWHQDQQVVRLCSQLTWVLVAPCILRVVVQAPIWFAGKSGAIDADTAVAALGVLKIAMGWPLQLAALAAMVGLLARNHTPVAAANPPGLRPAVSGLGTCRLPAAGLRVEARGEQPLELLLDVGGDHEQQLVAGLDRLLGVGHVDLAVAQDRDQRAVLRERDQPGRLPDVRRVRRAASSRPGWRCPGGT